jgi:hypothetical protein
MNTNTYNVQIRVPIGQGNVLRNVPVEAKTPYEARQIAQATYGQAGGVTRK